MLKDPAVPLILKQGKSDLWKCAYALHLGDWEPKGHFIRENMRNVSPAEKSVMRLQNELAPGEAHSWFNMEVLTDKRGWFSLQSEWIGLERMDMEWACVCEARVEGGGGGDYGIVFGASQEWKD